MNDRSSDTLMALEIVIMPSVFFSSMAMLPCRISYPTHEMRDWAHTPRNNNNVVNHPHGDNAANATSARRLYSSQQQHKPMDARRNLYRSQGVMNLVRYWLDGMAGGESDNIRWPRKN
jgi:hypothetical protein